MQAPLRDSSEKPESNLQARAVLGLGFLLLVMGLALFLPAGTLFYGAAWIYLGLFAGSSAAITLYLAKRDQDLLERRLKGGATAEQRPRQKAIQALSSVAFLGTLVVPGLDHRFSWSHLPLPLVGLGDALVVIGFVVVFLVFRENTFTSAVIEIAAEQRVIDTGPYAAVRHPMYSGALLLMVGTAPALGSLWGLVPAGLLTLTIVWRLLDEERFLADHLPGYRAYRDRTRYRLIPRLW